MIFEKVLAINKTTVISLTKFAILLATAIFAPLLHNQLITGSLVNATLFIAVATLSLEEAVLIGLLPSIFAVLAGTLPMVLAPLVPFIMLSNILLVLVFNSLKNSNYWLRFISASVLKFAFLSVVSFWAVNILFKSELIGVATLMLSWPQLVTALIGSVLAYVVLKGRKLI